MRKMIVCLMLLLIAFCNTSFGKDGDYAVSKIPSALKEKANVVKRSEILRFEITEDNKAIYYRKVAYTILNENGEKWSYFGEAYDKLSSVGSFEGTLFDAEGNKLKSLKKSDIKDVSGSDESNLADDNRLKWHSFFYKAYPYTVEYEIEVRYKGTMFLRDWLPQERPAMSVEASSFTIIIPASNPLRYKMFNYPGNPLVRDEKSKKIYNWETKNVVAQKQEYAAPRWNTLTTCVIPATENFVLDEYNGSNASWRDFGKFVYDLKKDRDALPDELKQKVHQLTDEVTDRKTKIRKLYEYLQSNTRYISIQLGVGGWQPFDAKYVGAKKYGDCKALTNFMYALLKEAGIYSVYTVINTEKEILIDLPSSQFNHVILFVPDGKDTTWLECTSQTASAGYLGDVGNKYALAVDENGGKLVKTPKYGLSENLQVRNIESKLHEDGTLLVIVNGRYEAEQQDNMHAVINYLSKDKVKEYLHEHFDFGTYDITSFNYKENKNELPSVEEHLDISVSNYATITGKRLFIVPNVMTRNKQRLKEDTARKYDVELNYEYRDIDSVEIELPSGYELESKPQDINLLNKFGKYTSTVKLSGNKLYYYRLMEQYSGRFPAKEYNELVKFYEAIYKADRNKVVLVKKE